MKIHRKQSTVSLLIKLILVLIIQSAALPVEAHSGLVLTGTGTATIDGVISPGEWGSAGSVNFSVNLPGGGTTPATVYVMNDDKNLYLAVQFAGGVDARQSAAFDFDNDHQGGSTIYPTTGDDVLLINPELMPSFLDETWTNDPSECSAAPQFCGPRDTDLVGGTSDGAGAYANDGTFSIYEFEHPLDSLDNSHDFSLSEGDIVGFNVFIRLINSNHEIADTYFPGYLVQDTYGDIVVAAFTSEKLTQAAKRQVKKLQEAIAAGAPNVGNKKKAIANLQKAYDSLGQGEAALVADTDSTTDPARLYEAEAAATEEISSAVEQGDIANPDILAGLEEIAVDKIAGTSRRVAKKKVEDATTAGADPIAIEEAKLMITEADAALEQAVQDRKLEPASYGKATENLQKAVEDTVKKHHTAYRKASKAAADAAMM